MTIDEEIKRRIIDLHSNEHVTNRKISKIVKKSSRDIIAVLKVSENKEIADEIIESTLYQGLTQSRVRSGEPAKGRRLGCALFHQCLIQGRHGRGTG